MIDTTLPTVSGKSVGENINGRIIKNTDAIRPVDDPYSQTGGIAILWGNIAKDGCVVKRSAVAPEMLVHSGPARVFDGEEEAIAAIYAGEIKDGQVVVIRYEGPKGGPGMREMLNPTSALAGMGLDKTVALILSLIHISEPTRQAEISYAVFCLKKKNKRHGFDHVLFI